MKLFGFDIPYGDDIVKTVGSGLGLLDTFNDRRTGSGISDILANKERAKYEYDKQYNAAAEKYNNQAMQMAAANRAASQAAAGARRAAAQATEANRQKANKKATQYMDKKYKETMAMYAPFQQSALQLLPQMQKSFEGGMNLSNNLLGMLQQPENMQLLNGAKTMGQAGPKLPSFFRGG